MKQKTIKYPKQEERRLRELNKVRSNLQDIHDIIVKTTTSSGKLTIEHLERAAGAIDHPDGHSFKPVIKELLAELIDTSSIPFNLNSMEFLNLLNLPFDDLRDRASRIEGIMGRQVRDISKLYSLEEGKVVISEYRLQLLENSTTITLPSKEELRLHELLTEAIPVLMKVHDITKKAQLPLFRYKRPTHNFEWFFKYDGHKAEINPKLWPAIRSKSPLK